MNTDHFYLRKPITKRVHIRQVYIYTLFANTKGHFNRSKNKLLKQTHILYYLDCPDPRVTLHVVLF